VCILLGVKTIGIAILLIACATLATAQAKPGADRSLWLTDDEAREAASAAIEPIDPTPCYNTYRQEDLEGFLLSARKNRLVGNRLNNSVYFYRVATEVCEYVEERDGKPKFTAIAHADCCNYGIVAVDRATAKTYWFGGKRKTSETFAELVRDEQLIPDSPEPILFIGLYTELVWGGSKANEIVSLDQLRGLVEENFRPAYSPSGSDRVWEQKVRTWWKQFRAREPRLALETTYQQTEGGTLARGYSFEGFEITMPESSPPPKGTPRLSRWTLIIKPDGTVQERPSEVVYASR